jgi:hypothetical protein
MADYRVYYCDATGKIFSADDFEARDDASATDRANALAGGRAYIFEVWQRDRLVHRHSKITTPVTGDKPAPLDRIPKA